jgi:hypothetical protein
MNKELRLEFTKEEVCDDWQIELKDLDGYEIIYHAYETGSYDGSAFTLMKKDGKLYENNGGHCSCYGLEGQWNPEESELEALKQQARSDFDWPTVLHLATKAMEKHPLSGISDECLGSKESK